MVLASYHYPVARGNRARFASRDDYIVQRVISRNPELCQVMQQAANLLRQDAGRFEPGSGWVGFPWLTIVFGSGALELHDRRGLAAQAFANEVEALIKEEHSKSPLEWDAADDEAPSTNARAFALALIRDRMGDAPERADGQMLTQFTPQVEPVAAKLVYVAYLLTHFFHSVRAGMGEPTSRWDYDDVAKLTAESRRTGAPDADDLAERVSRLMWDVLDLLGGPEAPDRSPNTKAPLPIQKSVRALLEEVIKGLEPTGRDRRRELRSYHLRLLTEVAWYFLTLGTPIYPGWTDLLLALMLEEGARTDRTFRSARPRYPDLRDLPKLVAGIYEPATKTSWEMTMDRLQSGDGGVSSADWSDIAADRGRTRVNLYWAAAEVLWAQAQACQGIPKDQDPLPPAAAFVTSFDLELDMALLATARGRTFRVALPVHLIQRIDKDSAQAELCWLIADVKPGSQQLDPGDLAALRNPVNWRLLTSEFDPDELRATPIVIHLSGCPLFSLPDPGKSAGDEAIQKILADLSDFPAAQNGAAARHDEYAFVHAVTVDEYLALRQSEAELIWSSWNPPNSDARRNRALPQDLMINGLDNPRFWISMGVPVGDAAIRHRLISQLSRQRIVALRAPDRTPASSGPGLLGARPGPDLELVGPIGESAVSGSQAAMSIDSAGAVGVAVNTRIGDDETSLLYWVGFDVVQADCNGFIHDLRHYARHLADPGPKKQPSPTQQCDLAGGRD